MGNILLIYRPFVVKRAAHMPISHVSFSFPRTKTLLFNPTASDKSNAVDTTILSLNYLTTIPSCESLTVVILEITCCNRVLSLQAFLLTILNIFLNQTLKQHLKYTCALYRLTSKTRFPLCPDILNILNIRIPGQINITKP